MDYMRILVQLFRHVAHVEFIVYCSRALRIETLEAGNNGSGGPVSVQQFLDQTFFPNANRHQNFRASDQGLVAQSADFRPR